MKDNLSKFVLIFIIALASALRLTGLDTAPIGFNDDESAFGYNAYSVLKTGRDEWGKLLPFPVFESFGDWKLVGYLYPVVLSEAIFGENEFATRLPSALFGIAAVVTTYLLAKKIFDKNVALVASFLLAISPWHIIASRNAFESDVLIFFLTLGTLFFLEGLSRKKFLTFSFIIFGLSLYIYRSSWLFVPVFISSIIFQNRKTLNNKRSFLIKNILVLVTIALPLIPTAFSFKGQSRFIQESFITGVQKSGIIDNLNQKRGVCQNFQKLPICSLVLNKYSAFTFNYFANYIANLSPETYYVRPTVAAYQGFSTRAPFYLFEFPLLIIGLTFFLKQKNPYSKILIAWILIAPIGASITGVANLGRLNIIMPAPQIISAFGLVTALKMLKSRLYKKIIITSFITISCVSLLGTTFDLFYYLPQISAVNLRYGYKQLFDYLAKEKNGYSQIIVSRRSDDAKQYIHYLFFEKVDPQEFLNPQVTTRYRDQNGWQVVEKIGNVYFYQSLPSLENLPPKSLIGVGEIEAIPVESLFTVKDPKGDKIFEVYNLNDKRVLKNK